SVYCICQQKFADLPSLPDFVARGGRVVSPSPPEAHKSSRPSTPTALPPPIIRDTYNYVNYLNPVYLGKGGFAAVWRYRKEGTRDEYYAVKVVERSRLSRTSAYEKLHREIQLHGGCSHPNIVKLCGYFQDNFNIYILLELCPDGTLLNRIYNGRGGCLSSYESFIYIRGIVEAVLYLFTKGILHRDLKPGNIFLDGNHVKLGDFGLAVSKGGHSNRSASGLSSISGTPNYLAPEVLHRRGHSEASEAWAIGCILYCMLIGRPPFETDNLQKTYNRIMRGEFSWPTIDGKNNVEQRAVMLVNRLLRIDPANRETVAGIKTSLYYQQYVENEQSDIVDQNSNALSSLSLNSQRVQQNGARHDCNGRQAISPHQPDRWHWYSPAYAPQTHDVNAIEYADSDPYEDQRPSTAYANEMGSIGVMAPRLTSFHDSGLGSDPHLLSPRNSIASRLELYVHTLNLLLKQSSYLVEIPFVPLLYVSKWVDYTNKYGFGCILSDGTVSVHFNDDSLIAVRQHNVKSASSDIFEKVRIANVYRSYMEKELTGASVNDDLIRDSWKRQMMPNGELPYLAYETKRDNFVFMLLSNGTVQVNFTNRHVKVILTPPTQGICPFDGRNSMLFTLIDESKHMATYRLEDSMNLGSTPFLQTKFVDILQEMKNIVNEHSFRVRTPPLEPQDGDRNSPTSSNQRSGIISTAC
ncbi:unnamed protein product, partial [Mesorhabditis belari]